jgi:hypothetical protein
VPQRCQLDVARVLEPDPAHADKASAMAAKFGFWSSVPVSTDIHLMTASAGVKLPLFKDFGNAKSST